MSTRSGKPYNHETKTPRRRQLSIKESTLDICNGNEEINLNTSTMSNRELRGKNSKAKDSILVKSDVSMTNTNTGQATESNWVISDVSAKNKRKGTTVKTSNDVNRNTIKNGNLEKDIENDINAPNVTTKQLRKRKSNNINRITESVDIDHTDAEENIKTASVVGNVTVIQEKNEQNHSDNNSGKEIKMKKNKAKCGKKRKQKRKSNTEAGDVIAMKNADTTFEKENGANNVNNSHKDLDQSSPSAVRKKLRSKKLLTDEQDKIDIAANQDDKRTKVNTSLNKTSITPSKANTESKVNQNSASKRNLRKRTFSIENCDPVVEPSNEKDEIPVKQAKDIDINTVSCKKIKSRKSVQKDTTLENHSSFDNNITLAKSITPFKNNTKEKLSLNTSNTSNKRLTSKKSIVEIMIEKEKSLDLTYEKDGKIDQTFDNETSDDTCSLRSHDNKSSFNVTYDKNNETYEKNISSSFDSFKKGANSRKSSIRDETFDKSSSSIRNMSKEDIKRDNVLSSSNTCNSLRRQTIDICSLDTQRQESTCEPFNNMTGSTRKSLRLSAATEHILNTTFEKLPAQSGNESQSSLISSDNSVSDKSEISRISITSDDTTDDIVNTTPLLIESSVDETQVSKSPISAPTEITNTQTPLQREGTFTKESSDVVPQSPATPTRRTSSVTPAPGCTPYHVGKSSQKKPLLNVTRSIEKRLSVEPAPRLTRVMFCSPVDTPAVVAQEKRKVIKSNLKGSNKSFVFNDSACSSRPARKRSYTHSGVEDGRAKRTRLAEDLQNSVNRLSRPRTVSATEKMNETTPNKMTTPSKSKSEAKPVRTRLPNFAALHQKQFAKMESLDECQERKAKRARQMLTPSAPANMLNRISPKDSHSNTELHKSTTKDQTKLKDKADTPTKKPFTVEPVRPGFTRFGFKLNMDVNPFSVPPKTDKYKPNGIIPRQGTVPSLTGTTSLRREVAKKTIMREKSFLENKRSLNRSENRTIIKGVRTNRRFELQMKLRNIE